MVQKGKKVMSPLKILFRTVGNHQMGMGDLWGSIALADEFYRATQHILFVVTDDEESKEVLRRKGYPFEAVKTFEEELGIIKKYEPHILIVNQLNNPSGYIKTLKRYAKLLVTIDDAGDAAKFADLNINVLYPISGSISDFKYITLREEFQRFNKISRNIKDRVSTLLVTQGGSDPHAFSLKILRALDRVGDDFSIISVIGPAFKNHVELEYILKDMKKLVRVVRNAQNMAELMWESDMAVTAGGITMFELACVGTPSIVVCAYEYEQQTAQRLEKEGVVINLGFGGYVQEEIIADWVTSLMNDRLLREQMSRKGKELIDGKGCERIVKLILERASKA